jgi:hypothetical protein
VDLTRKQVFEVVRVRGRTDAARGRPLSDADKLPEPFRSIDVTAHSAATEGRPAGPERASG